MDCNRAMQTVNNGSAFPKSLISRIGTGILPLIGLTFNETELRQKGGELRQVPVLHFFRNFLPGSQLSFEHNSNLNPQNNKATNQFTPEQLERFKTCLRDMFEVEYRSHRYEKGGEAGFNGYTKRGAGWYSIFKIGEFHVRTDQRSYSAQQLKIKHDKLGSGVVAGGNVWGYTDPKSPYVNAIANDAEIELKGNEFLGLWVFELGNALSVITRLTPELQPGQSDRYEGLKEPGVAFEDCVFGGKLNPNGGVTPFKK